MPPHIEIARYVIRGRLLHECRKAKRLSLRAVRDKTGISHAHLSLVENGMTGLGFENAVRLCDLYGLPLEQLAATVRPYFSAENLKNLKDDPPTHA